MARMCFVTSPFHNVDVHCTGGQAHPEFVMTGSFKLCQLLFADDLVFLALSESGFQDASYCFTAACDITGMKIITYKTELYHLSRNSVQCFLQVGRVSLKQVEKFKYVESYLCEMEDNTKN